MTILSAATAANTASIILTATSAASAAILSAKPARSALAAGTFKADHGGRGHETAAV